MTTLARRVAESHGFQNFILGVILVTAVIVGVETSDTADGALRRSVRSG